MALVFLEFRAKFESFDQALRLARVAFMLSASDVICNAVQLEYNYCCIIGILETFSCRWKNILKIHDV